MAWLISLTVTHLDPDRHGLVDILDCLLVLSLNLRERVPVLVPLTQRLVPLPNGLQAIKINGQRHKIIYLLFRCQLLLQIAKLLFSTNGIEILQLQKNSFNLQLQMPPQNKLSFGKKILSKKYV
jgi:hypothetical protein